MKKGIVDKWQYAGRVCTRIMLWNWMAYKVETVMDKIVEYWLKLVCMQGDFSTNVDIMTVIQGLNSAGYKVIFMTDSWDEVWPIVRFKSVILSISMEIPVDWEVVNYLPQMTSYLREKDEVLFKIENKGDYDKFRAFQKTKNISAPMKILEVKWDYKEAFENMLMKEVASMDNLIIKYV